MFKPQLQFCLFLQNMICSEVFKVVQNILTLRPIKLHLNLKVSIKEEW